MDKAKLDRAAEAADTINRELENTAVEAFRQFPSVPGIGSPVVSALTISLANAIMYECLLHNACPHKAFMQTMSTLLVYADMEGLSMGGRPLFIELERIAAELKDRPTTH